MTRPQETARALAESFSELLNCAAYVTQHATPPPDVLETFRDATDRLLDLHATSPLNGPPGLDTSALIAIVTELRAALSHHEPNRVRLLCRDLLAALGIPMPTTAA